MMGAMRTRFAVACLMLAAFVAALPAQQAPPSGEAARLDAMIRTYDANRAAAMRALGGNASADPLANRGPGGTPELAQAAADTSSAFLTQLATIRTAELTHDQWILYGIVEYGARMDAETGAAFFWLPTIVTPYSSPLRNLAAPFQRMRVGTPAERTRYVEALNALPPSLAAYETRLQEQLDHGVAMPAEELRLVLPFIRSIGAPAAFAVAPERLGTASTADQTAFAVAVTAAIAGAVTPAVEHLAQYLDGPYRERASRAVGLGQYPNGAAFYRHLIRQQTGLDLTPEQIHERGLAEVARINGELDAIRRQVGFDGTLAEFKAFLRTDRRFYPKTAEEIGQKMMTAIRLVEPRMAEFFPKMPKAPYGVRRLAPELEPSMTYGYYSRPDAQEPTGYYNYNGLNADQRSLTMVTAIIFHELLPGHHFQLALLAENPALSARRKAAMYGSYTEGWGEYASDLAGEMGGYPDPYARAGRLGMDLFTSSRLVVDTGMNALGWSRERAVQYMKDNTFESDTQIDTETLRYSVDMPAQALGYKLGGLKFRDLRERMKQTKGASFDIRAFHGYVLDAGEMPIGMLDQHLDCLLTGEKHKGR